MRLLVAYDREQPPARSSIAREVAHATATHLILLDMVRRSDRAEQSTSSDVISGWSRTTFPCHTHQSPTLIRSSTQPARVLL